MGGFYNRSKLTWNAVEGVLMLAACGPPGGGRRPLTPRFTRHFHQLCMPPPSDASMRRIFGSIVSGFMRHAFPAEVELALGSQFAQGAADVFTAVSERLLPTPSKIHYTFNLRDISKVCTSLGWCACAMRKGTVPLRYRCWR